MRDNPDSTIHDDFTYTHLDTQTRTDTNTIALYIRLSLEDENAGESNSIKTQRALLNHFLDNHHELSRRTRIEIVDDGYSGTNFDRPGITELLTKARNLEVDCIAVKDFSRFGRSYIEVGNYLEQVFPFLGVRFISINDNYDSNTKQAADLDVALKSLIYDLYSKDLSLKCKSGKLAKMKRGEFINPYAPYGFVKSAQNKNKLEIDPEAAEVVKLVFDLALQGKGQAEVARILNARCTLSPNEYKVANGGKRSWKSANRNISTLWSGTIVRRLLIDERYTGSMVSRKFERLVVGDPNKLKYYPQEEWIVVQNTHEAIISKGLFDEVQVRFKKRETTYKKAEKRIFCGLIRCHHCGRFLNRRGKGKPYYICPTPTISESPDCFNGKIMEPAIINAVLSTIQAHAKLFVQIQKKSAAHSKTASSQLDKLTSKVKQQSKDLTLLKQQKKELYEAYNDDKVSKEDYFAKRQRFDEEITKVTATLTALQAEVRELEQAINLNSTSDHPWATSTNITELTRPLVEKLIKSITIYDTNHLEIKLNYTDWHCNTNLT